MNNFSSVEHKHLSRGFGSPLVYIALLLTIAAVSIIFYKTSAGSHGEKVSDDLSSTEKPVKSTSNARRVTSRSSSSNLDSGNHDGAFDLNNASPELQAELEVQKAVVAAREELRALNGKLAPSAEQQEEKQTFREQLSAASPEERAHLISDYRASMEQLRAEREDALTDEDRARKSRLEKIVQLDGMMRFARHSGAIEELRPEASALLESINRLASGAKSYSEDNFSQEWGSVLQLQDELRQKHLKIRRSIQLAAQTSK